MFDIFDFGRDVFDRVLFLAAGEIWVLLALMDIFEVIVVVLILTDEFETLVIFISVFGITLVVFVILVLLWFWWTFFVVLFVKICLLFIL